MKKYKAMALKLSFSSRALSSNKKMYCWQRKSSRIKDRLVEWGWDGDTQSSWLVFPFPLDHPGGTLTGAKLENQPLRPVMQPWLTWLSGLNASLWTKRSLVGFPVRAQAWVAGQVPSRGCTRGNHTLMFLFLSFSFPSPLKINKIFFKNTLKHLGL